LQILTEKDDAQASIGDREIAAADRQVFRFAPSPNGRLHLGHAYSALLNARMAAEVRGRYLLRIEDIDISRSRPEFEAAIIDDLAWLGLFFAEPPRRQSEHVVDYARALKTLEARRLVYPCFCTRAEIERMSEGLRDPDGAPRHNGACRAMPAAEAAARRSAGERAALRLDMPRALATVGAALTWREYGEGAVETLVQADPAAWGDVVLRRKDSPASYHLAVVVDDGGQRVSDIVRGRDLYHATSVHRLLQELLGLPAPRYRHHRLVVDASGRKMSKSAQSQTLSSLREQGFTAEGVKAALGFGAATGSPLEAAIN
jgi:glutamyl-Q tRNA(Asp) synthetase